MAVEQTTEDYVKGYEARANGIKMNPNWPVDTIKGWMDGKKDDDEVDANQKHLGEMYGALESADKTIAKTLCHIYSMPSVHQDVDERDEWMRQVIRHIGALYHSTHGGDDIVQELMEEAGL